MNEAIADMPHDEPLTWPEHFELVQLYLDRYIDEHDTEELRTNRRINLRFRIDDLNRSPNAHAEKLGDNEFLIVFNGGLIELLTRYAYTVARHSLLTFAPNGTKISDEARLLKAHSWVFLIWIDYIFQHEFAHVHCGHLELLEASSPRWNEFGVSSGAARLSPSDHWALEAQADRFAAANIWGQIIRHHESIGPEIYEAYSIDQFVADYVYCILFMYKLLDRLSARTATPVHPPAFYRAFIFQIFFADTYDRLEACPRITHPNMHELVRQLYIEFYGREGDLSMDLFLAQLESAQLFFNSVSGTLRALDLPTI